MVQYWFCSSGKKLAPCQDTNILEIHSTVLTFHKPFKVQLSSASIDPICANFRIRTLELKRQALTVKLLKVFQGSAFFFFSCNQSEI